MPDLAIKEAKSRIRASFRHIGISFPNKRITLNLAPSDIKKVGTSFDLPMAVAMLLLIMEVEETQLFEDALFFGEMGLDGSIKRVNGLLPSVISAMKHGYKKFFVPEENLFELEYIPDIVLYPLKHFEELSGYFLYSKELLACENHKDLADLIQEKNLFAVDFSQIR